MTVHILSNIPISGFDNYMLDLESLLAKSVISTDPNITEVASHLINAGGKRIRPALAIAAAASAGIDANTSILLSGVSVELVHLASLYHDDVMDDALQRRNVPSVNSKWSNLIAIVVGDFLLAKAAGIAARLGQNTAQLLADTLGLLCEGQILEVNATYDSNRTVDHYLDAISGKTASLMATSCKIGALVANTDESLALDLERIGYLFGITYQIRDDILDIVATFEELGKAPAQDLAEGVYTLPIIIALADEPKGSDLRKFLERNSRDLQNESELEFVRSKIITSGAIEKSLAIARGYADEASAIGSGIGNPVAEFLGLMSSKLLDDVEATFEKRTAL